LPQAARVRAEVLDVLGRTVAVLSDHRAYAAGPYVLTWNGRDRSGSEARPGVYFVRARARGDVRVLKIVLTR
jgi:flagellar hook assembly protein FlgD